MRASPVVNCQPAPPSTHANKGGAAMRRADVGYHHMRLDPAIALVMNLPQRTG